MTNLHAGQSVVVIGKTGQLACALQRVGSVSGLSITSIGRPELDLAQPRSLDSTVLSARPAFVVNAAAYTAVERAETEPDLTFAVNSDAVGSLARLCDRAKIPFLTVSTDYVFDGTKNSPYVETDPVCPLNVYGASKAAGEEQVRDALERHIILRTSWVYSSEGRNFVLAMTDRIRNKLDTKVVVDQIGSPTYAEDLADKICEIISSYFHSDAKITWGTYHLTNSGQTAWFGVAEKIFQAFRSKGIEVPPLLPISSKDFPSKVRRPHYSVLDNSKIAQALSVEMPSWQDALDRCLAKSKETQQ